MASCANISPMAPTSTCVAAGLNGRPRKALKWLFAFEGVGLGASLPG